MTEILLFLTGIVVGAMNAIAGGGMLVGFPALLAAGYSPLIANATGYLVIVPGQLLAAFGYRRYLRKVPAQYLLLLIPCFVGGLAGAWILRNTSSLQFERLVPGLIFLAVILFALQPFLQLHMHRHIKTGAHNWQRLLIFGLILLGMATYGGFFGPGFGFMMLAFLSFTSLRDIHLMNGLKSVAGATIATASIVCLLGSHLIDWRTGLIMAAGNALGGYYGAGLSQRVSSHGVRIIVIVVGLAAATYLAFRTY